MPKIPKVIVIGAGPAGLGVSLSLGEDCTVLERHDRPGGLSMSFESRGAVFDWGGHSFHSAHPEVRELVFNALEMYEQKREARCFLSGQLIEYPFQKHFRSLQDETVVAECVRGLRLAGDSNGAGNFEEYLKQRFGEGIARHFMLPYNRKLWRRDLRRLATDWTNQRVAAPEGVAESFQHDGGQRKPLQSDTMVAYPARGGFGEIFTALGRQTHDLRWNEDVRQIDARARVLTTAAGHTYSWRELVSTLPLPQLLALLPETPARLLQAARSLEALSLKLVFVVIRHPVDTPIQRIYASEDEIAAHKIVINHNSSPYLRALPHHGVVFEISVGPFEEPSGRDIPAWIEMNLVRVGVVQSSDEILSIEIRDVPQAYPVPTHSREAVVEQIQAYLQSLRIHTVGRFGEWAYINSDEALHRGFALGRRLAGS